MTNGGKRPGAGRPKGRQGKKTLEQLAVAEAFNQRVLKQADQLFNAQLGLAVGSVRIFRVEESKDKDGKTKREHVPVTDVCEIKEVLDENGGESGVVNDTYYLITAVIPDNRAIDSMLNRAIGKPKDSVDLNINVADLTDEELEVAVGYKG